MLSNISHTDACLSLGLAFVGGYGDAASLVMAKTFTGHVTGNLVLAAVAVAANDWRATLGPFSTIVTFLIGILSSVMIVRPLKAWSSWPLLPTIMGIEVILIVAAFFALSSGLAHGAGVFVILLSLALGLQNGAFRRVGGIGVHTTYLTGMITSLIATEAERYASGVAPLSSRAPDPKIETSLRNLDRLRPGRWDRSGNGFSFQGARDPPGRPAFDPARTARGAGLTKHPKNSTRRCPTEPSHVFLHRRTLRARTVREFAKIVFLAWAAVALFAVCAYSQTDLGETLSGPDSHETGQGPHGHLFGDWGGERSRLLERGVRFDFQYISDSLWNINSEQKQRFASWNRFRGTVDIDLGTLVGQRGLYFHATALWQGGGNLGAYLGLLTSPSGMSSANTCRLDSWWIEKRWLDERITARVGQFAGQDFYGAQHDAASFIFEPMGYALGNLFTDFESFDPPSTPAFELRFVPIHNVYVKSMVEAEDREPFAHNQTGFVPQFRGVPVSVSEIGFTPGKKASSVRAFDNVESRRGYSGLYQFGASYNPGKFPSPTSATPRSGNYLLYWMASQALWRVDPKEAKGVDATFAYDWSPPDLNRNNTLLTAGVRFNEPLPVHIHNTMSLGYVRNSLSPQFQPPGAPPWKTEHGVEFNTLLDPLPMLLVQPVIQYYANVGGRAQRAVVFGFRTKVEF